MTLSSVKPPSDSSFGIREAIGRNWSSACRPDATIGASMPLYSVADPDSVELFTFYCLEKGGSEGMAGRDSEKQTD